MSQIQPYEGSPDKQRLIAAMRGEPTDRVPNFEVLIEDQHVERLLGRKAGNTLGVGGDPAKGSEAAEGARPMYPAGLFRTVPHPRPGCDRPGKPLDADPATQARRHHRIWNDRSLKSRADLERIVWPDEARLAGTASATSASTWRLPAARASA